MRTSRYTPILSGREARRKHTFGETTRKKGAGWTRKMRKGRTSRLRPQDEERQHGDS